eukprot:2302496-Alexandrium_andersonii.AAC.1
MPVQPKSASQVSRSSAFHCGASLMRHSAVASSALSMPPWPTMPRLEPSPRRRTTPRQESRRIAKTLFR